MSKIEKRKASINQLEAVIADTKEKIILAKSSVAAMEDKMESRRAELQHQKMLLKFDAVDQVRQQFSDLVAQRDVALGMANGDEIPEEVIVYHLGNGAAIERRHRNQEKSI